MSAYKSEQETYYARKNAEHEANQSAQGANIIGGAVLAGLIALLSSGNPFVAFIGSFLVIWIISYLYVGISLWILGGLLLLVPYTPAYIFEKVTSHPILLSFIANVIVFVICIMSNNAHDTLIDGLMFPINIIISIFGLK